MPEQITVALEELIERVERDLHEPDKLLCATRSAKGVLGRLDQTPSGEEPCQSCGGTRFKTSDLGVGKFYNTDLPCPDCSQPSGEEGEGLEEAAGADRRQHLNPSPTTTNTAHPHDQEAPQVSSGDGRERCEKCGVYVGGDHRASCPTADGTIGMRVTGDAS